MIEVRYERPVARLGIRKLALAGAALLVAAGCRGAPTPAPVPGATIVRGTESLAWTQAGAVSSLHFRAYVDGRPVALGAAVCDQSTPEAACTSPLPPLADGVHTLALTSVFTQSGLESAPTPPITVQKLSGSGLAGAASFPDAAAHPASLRVETVVTGANGLAFAVDIVARGVRAPAQLAWLPDGRLLVAEADGRVRVIHPGEPDRRQPAPALDAHDAHALLKPIPIGPLGLARHPDFLRNRFVYVAFLARERLGRTRLLIVRLREVGDTLGDPATLFQAPVVTTAGTAESHGDGSVLAQGGPRLAFGPDGFMYLALPLGVEFDREPAASSPHASMLRLADDGRASDVGPLSGVSAHPLGFVWHPSTGALWVAFPGEHGEAVLRPVTGRTSGVGLAEPSGVGLRMAEGASRASRSLMLAGTETAALELTRAFLAARENESPGVVRLNVPIQAEGLLAGILDRVGDVVSGHGGTLFLATHNAERAEAFGAAGPDVIVRLTPRAR